MARVTDADYARMPPAQAADLIRVLDRHAAWVLQREAPPGTDNWSATRRLKAVQNAFEDYRACHAEYAARYRTDHLPAPARGADRLAQWCRTVRVLLHTAAGVADPVALTARTYALADALAARLGREPVARVPGAAEAMEAVIRWCESVAGAATPAALPPPPAG